MAGARICILLVLSWLPAAVGPAPASPAEHAPIRGITRPDTLRAFAPRGSWNGRLPWSRGDRFLRRDDPRATQYDRRVGLGEIVRPSGGARLAGGPVADPNLWGADGNVVGIARSGNTLYIAGSFRSVGENSGGFVPVDARTGDVLRPLPKVAGSVDVIAPDGSGGWYIGGEFTAVGGKPRYCLAEIRADGSVSDWDPSVTGSPGYNDPPQVSAIAVDGNRVYVGGGFREIGGLPRLNLGCVDARTGAVLDWKADTHVGAWVYALACHDSTVFIGGFFSSVGGQPRSNLAAVGATTGAVTPWTADASASVWALLVRGDTLWAAGEFGWIAGGPRSMLAAIDIQTAQLLSFDAHAD